MYFVLSFFLSVASCYCLSFSRSLLTSLPMWLALSFCFHFGISLIARPSMAESLDPPRTHSLHYIGPTAGSCPPTFNSNNWAQDISHSLSSFRLLFLSLSLHAWIQDVALLKDGWTSRLDWSRWKSQVANDWIRDEAMVLSLFSDAHRCRVNTPSSKTRDSRGSDRWKANFERVQRWVGEVGRFIATARCVMKRPGCTTRFPINKLQLQPASVDHCAEDATPCITL